MRSAHNSDYTDQYCKKRDQNGWVGRERGLGSPGEVRRALRLTALLLVDGREARTLERQHADLPINVGYLRPDPFIHDRDT